MTTLCCFLQVVDDGARASPMSDSKKHLSSPASPPQDEDSDDEETFTEKMDDDDSDGDDMDDDTSSQPTNPSMPTGHPSGENDEPAGAENVDIAVGENVQDAAVRQDQKEVNSGVEYPLPSVKSTAAVLPASTVGIFVSASTLFDPVVGQGKDANEVDAMKKALGSGQAEVDGEQGADLKSSSGIESAEGDVIPSSSSLDLGKTS